MVSRFRSNAIRPEYVFTRPLSHEAFTTRSTGGKLCQFGRRDFRLQKPTVQTDRHLREHPDARFIQIFASGMHNHLTSKFGLIVGPARWTHKTPVLPSIPASGDLSLRLNAGGASKRLTAW